MGYLRDEFIKRNQNTNEYMGTITDGEFKVEVEFPNITENPYKQGQKLNLTGQVLAHGMGNLPFYPIYSFWHELHEIILILIFHFGV